MRIEESKLYLEAFKVIVIGFFVALVGILLPALGSETRHAFEKLKASRLAYSEAKTRLNYLPVRLCSLPFTEAAALLQTAHFHKHQAELYEELREHLVPFGQNPEEWGDEAYHRLMGYRSVLEANAQIWDGLGAPDRLDLLVKNRATLDKIFPPPLPPENRPLRDRPGTVIV